MLVEEEFGGQMLSASADFFHESVLEGWNYEDDERARATRRLSALRKKWEREDSGEILTAGKEGRP